MLKMISRVHYARGTHEEVAFSKHPRHAAARVPEPGLSTGTPPIVSMRRLLLAVLALGLASMAVELLLLDHDEDTTQLVPLIAAGLAFLALAWHAVTLDRPSRYVFRFSMLVLIACGVLGIYYHYQGNVEFQLEMNPDLAGLDLATKVLRAKAPPALAPGHLALLGLLGLVTTYGQARDGKAHTTSTEEKE